MGYNVGMSGNLMVNITKLREELATIPKGCISHKRINGKVYCYRQWTEDGKTRSEYLSEEEAERFKVQIARRRELQRELSRLAKESEMRMNIPVSTMEIKSGVALANWAQEASTWERRDKFENIMKYLRWKTESRVCIIYGLRRTGKTTMLMQAAADLTEEEFAKAFYIKASVRTSIHEMSRVLADFEKRGYKYAFIDEATLMEDFIDAAAIFSDSYAAAGMKIVLSGTDSLGFWFTLDNELYDRAYMIHTTFIPYSEHARLLKTPDIDEYIRFGGMLQAGELAFTDADARREDASFRTDESTRRYIDTAIAQNIQRSLRCFKGGSRFFSLRELYEAGELTNAINRIIEDMNHGFLVDVVTRRFKSRDLHSAADLMAKNRKRDARFDLLDAVDESAVTGMLMDILSLWNRDDQTVEVTEQHVKDIQDWLERLDLIAMCRVRRSDGSDDVPRTIFTQPGMRYCQAQALVFAIGADSRMRQFGEGVMSRVCETILNDVRGRMLEDIVLYETTRSLACRGEGMLRPSAFKVMFPSGEFDMVVTNPQKGTCDICEIKHTAERADEQFRHLVNPEKCAVVEKSFGRIASRVVYYRGSDFDHASGVRYRNVENYLSGLKA